MYAFAAVSGQPHVRVLFGDELPTFRRGTNWHRIVGVRDDDAIGLDAFRDVAGGQIEIGDGGALLRWCVYSYAWPVDGKYVVLGAAPLRPTLGGAFLCHISVVSSPIWTIDRSNDSHIPWLSRTLSIVLARHRLNHSV